MKGVRLISLGPDGSQFEYEGRTLARLSRNLVAGPDGRVDSQCSQEEWTELKRLIDRALKEERNEAAIRD